MQCKFFAGGTRLERKLFAGDLREGAIVCRAAGHGLFALDFTLIEPERSLSGLDFALIELALALIEPNFILIELGFASIKLEHGLIEVARGLIELDFTLFELGILISIVFQ